MPSPLTPAQRGILVSLLYGGDRVAPDLYHLQLVLRLTGPLDAAGLRAAAARLVRRTPALRTGFAHAEPEGPRARVAAPEQAPPPAWREADVTDLPAEARDAATERLARAERTEPFSLDRPPLLRVLLVRTGDDRHALVLTHHHLACDGWSQGALVRELFAEYGGDTAPNEHHDHDEHDEEYEHDEEHEEHERLWRAALAGVSPLLLSPAGATSGRLPAPVRIQRDADEGLTRRLAARAGGLGVTLDAVVQGAWSVLLAQLTARDTVVVGGLATPYGRAVGPGARNGAGIGALATLQPLPVRVRAEQTWQDLLTGVQERLDELAPTSAAFGAADIQHLTGAGPLFDTAAVVEQPPVTHEDIAPLAPGLRLESARGHDANHYAASFSAVPGERLALRLDHRPGALGELAPETLLDALHHTLAEIADHPDRPVGLLTLPGAVTQEAPATPAVPATPPDAPDGTFTLHGQVARHAAARPSAIAVGAPEGDLTYAELDAAVDRFALRLVRAGAGPGDVVALVLPRSRAMTVAQLAVGRAGAAYLPVDPDYPAERLTFMLADASPALTVTTDALLPALPHGAATRALVLDGTVLDGTVLDGTDAPDTGTDTGTSTDTGTGTSTVTDAAALLPPRTPHPDDPAYVIYTSGSTGEPKGVVVPHRGLRHLAAELGDRCAVTSASRVLQFSSPSFDAAVLEACAAFAHGATLVIPPPVTLAGEALAGTLAEGRITHTLIPPAVLASVPPAELPDLVTLIVGGDACPGDLVATWSRGRRMVNAYGPTETTVAATFHGPLSRDAEDGGDAEGAEGTEGARDAAPLIGTPVRGTRVHVLGPGLRPVPPGVPGDLYVGGEGLALGYLGRPALTADRFVPDPYGPPGAVMYRTGDRARWTREGLLDFAGRSDDQVKIRGFRIEPGEVEAALRTHPGVARAAVAVRRETGGEKILTAHVTPGAGAGAGTGTGMRTATPSPGELRDHLAALLPAHLVPAEYHVWPVLPVTPNGKLDRGALAERRPRPTGTAPPPGRTDEEEDGGDARTVRLLRELFDDVLGRNGTALDDDFFAIGGDSIRMVQLIGRARKEGLAVSPRDAVGGCTIRSLARAAAPAAAPTPAPAPAARHGARPEGAPAGEERL